MPAPRSAAKLRQAYEESLAQMPETGWPQSEGYRRHMTLEHGGDPDALVCAVCGVAVKHEDARIVIGLTDYDNDFERVHAGLDPENRPMPPVAFCEKHNSDEEVRKLAVLGVSVKSMPAAAKKLYGTLRQV